MTGRSNADIEIAKVVRRHQNGPISIYTDKVELALDSRLRSTVNRVGRLRKIGNAASRLIGPQFVERFYRHGRFDRFIAEARWIDDQIISDRRFAGVAPGDQVLITHLHRTRGGDRRSSPGTCR